MLPNARIEVRKVAHPGVCIRFGVHEMTLEDERHAVRFRFDPDSDAVVAEAIPT